MNKVISAVKTNVPKTKLEKKARDLKLQIQKTKASGAKLKKTLFDIKQSSKGDK
tara:strand:- start:317 stop:478 length:162 start_codon:yes stop_codon:yes gene_type:complete